MKPDGGLPVAELAAQESQAVQGSDPGRPAQRWCESQDALESGDSLDELSTHVPVTKQAGGQTERGNVVAGGERPLEGGAQVLVRRPDAGQPLTGLDQC